ncbi:MAG: winged helix-turn-helix transcriptional regulator [Candidatus Margulisiibacteriota bacterium]|nr:winged helix-turn-helix transcriptional regulator [Candidatus Margulisiibacteriota bacterium]
MVNENELKVIEEISREKGLTQRDLSKKTQLSLGAVNVILKRLVKRGILKAADYSVTPKGFAAKAKHSYNYILKTVSLVKLVKGEIGKIVLEEYNRGQKKFVILGDDDLADIIELALKGFDYKRVTSVKAIEDKSALVLLSDKSSKSNGFRALNIAERLGESYWGVDL